MCTLLPAMHPQLEASDNISAACALSPGPATPPDGLMLGDFGLAIQQQQELPFLKAGTLDYMAPEVVQVRGAVRGACGAQGRA